MDAMNEWTEEAMLAIRLCEQWAADCALAIPSQLFLFGSAIYKGGEQFDSTQSDLDIVLVFPERTDALSRFHSMRILYEKKQILELNMLPTLQRRTCDEPGVSIVAITPLELRANIHKSGARRFFDKNFFYDLVAKRQSLGIPSAGIRFMRDENRQALEYVQKVRNEFLAVSANGTGGLREYSGTDPMPKALLRSAAQLVPDTAEGEWYDTRLGLELIYEILRTRRTEVPAFENLFNKISVRRGGRGKQANLSADDQLLLAEMLFDHGATVSTEEVITWDIQIIGKSLTEENVTAVFLSLSRVVPDAKLIGKRQGSLILRIRSSLPSFELLQKLDKLSVLAQILEVDGLRLWRVTDDNSDFNEIGESLQNLLVANVHRWNPKRNLNWRDEEDDFASYLNELLANEPRLLGVTVLRNLRFDGVEIPFEIDFLLTRTAPDGTKERVGIDVVRMHSASTFFYKVSQLLPLGQPVVLVALGKRNLLDALHGDTLRLAQLNANVKVVMVPTDD